MDPSASLSIRERFAGFQEADFCDWLSRGFKSFYSKERVSKSAVQVPSDSLSSSAMSEGIAVPPFDFAYALIGKGESLLDDIEDIYIQQLPDEKKILFRLSLGRLLRQCIGDEQFPEPAVSDLIYLMSMVRAYESLDCLAPVVGRGRYGLERKWLQYEAISAFKALLPAKEAIEGLCDLVTQPNFYIGYSFDILTALCRANPSRWLSVFEMMRIHISNLYEKAHSLGDDAIREIEAAARTFAKAFANFMPTNEIGQVAGIELTALPQEVYASGTWLVKSLFIGDNSPIIVFHDRSTFLDDPSFIALPIQVANQQSRTAIIEWEWGKYRIFRSLTCECDKIDLLNLVERNQSSGQTRAIFAPMSAQNLVQKFRYTARRMPLAG